MSDTPKLPDYDGGRRLVENLEAKIQRQEDEIKRLRAEIAEWLHGAVDAIKLTNAENDRLRLNWRTVGADLTDLPRGDAEVLVDLGGFRCVACGARTWNGITFWEDDNLQRKVQEGHRWVPVSELLEAQ